MVLTFLILSPSITWRPDPLPCQSWLFFFFDLGRPGLAWPGMSGLPIKGIFSEDEGGRELSGLESASFQET